MSKIGIDIEANVAGLDNGLAQGEARVVEFNNAVKKSTEVLTETSAAAAKLLDRYDPLTARLRELKSDFAALNKEAQGGKVGGNDDSRLDAAYVAIQKEIKSTEAAMKGMAVVGDASLQKVGMSAKATAAAMRNVPAQFTDIIVSLQAGQSPMQVLFQQGGQLKDMFGGAGNAARALGGYVLGLISPMTLSAAAAAVLGKAWYDGAQESENFSRTLIMTGNAAGTTAGRLMDSARLVAEQANATQGATAEALNQLAATGQVSATVMNDAAKAALELEQVGVASVQEVVKEFAEIGKDPVKAVERLNEKYNFLTVAVYEQIRALQDQGREDDAAALAQKTLADELSARAEKIRGNLNLLGKSWLFVKESAKGAWDAMLNIGREDSLTDQLAKAQAELDKMILARDGKRALGSSKAREDLDNTFSNEAAVRAKIEGLKEEIALTNRLAREQVEGNQKVEAAIDKANEKKNTTRTKTPNDDYGQLMNRLSGLDSNYSRDLETLYGAYQKGKLGLDAYRASVELLIEKQPFATKAAQEEKKAREEQQKVIDATTQAEERAGKAATEFTVNTINRVEAIQRQIELLGKTPDEAAQINAFADIDRQATALLLKLQELRANVSVKGGDTSGIDDLIAKLPVLANKAKGEAATALGKLKDAQDDLNASWEYGADEALRKYLDEVGNVAAQSEKLVTNGFKKMEDAFVNWAKTGKLNSEDLFDSIISDLLRMQVQASITGPLAGLMESSGGFGGLLSGLFGGSGTADTSGIGTAMSLMNSLHTGGIVGSAEGSGLRLVSPVVFNEAPRFHSGGIVGDEVPIVAKRGEGVFTQGQMQAMGGANVTVNVINNASGTKATQSQRSDGSGNKIIDIMIEQVDSAMASNISRGNGKTAAALESTYGLSRVAGAH